MKTLVVFNPSANGFKARKRWPTIEPILKKQSDLKVIQTVEDPLINVVRILYQLQDRVIVYRRSVYCQALLPKRKIA